ncbi:hypothetical protein [Absidia glauca]|uniref:Protein kinase domain-containing protein n=1 Tax=Absidia glauca TaxID=4829 RepID=A0A168MBP5_ABSGL|nr:hypothetical protein [Absidia glauca]
MLSADRLPHYEFKLKSLIRGNGTIPQVKALVKEGITQCRNRHSLGYLKLCLYLAALSGHPLSVGQCLLDNHIGSSHALLYQDVAYHYCTMDRTTKAQDVLRKGIVLNAQPLDHLQRSLWNRQQGIQETAPPSLLNNSYTTHQQQPSPKLMIGLGSSGLLGVLDAMELYIHHTATLAADKEQEHHSRICEELRGRSLCTQLSDVFELQPNVRSDQLTMQAHHLGAKAPSQSKGKQRQEPLPDHSQVRHQEFTRLEQGWDENYDRRTTPHEDTATTTTIHQQQQQQEDTHSPQRQAATPYTIVEVPLRFEYKQSLVDSQVIGRTTHHLVQASKYSAGSLRQIKRPPRKAVKKVETTLTLDQETVPLLEHLGDGNYGSVCKVKWKNQLVAIKIHKLPDRWDHYMLQHIAQKSPVAHRYVVRSHSLYLDTKSSYRIMDYSSQGTLWDFQQSFCRSDIASVPEPLVQLFTLRILQAVAMLHSINVVHMDLKLDNILLDYSLADEATPSTTATVPFKRSIPPPYAPDSDYWNKISLKLIDFGLAVNLDLLASPAPSSASTPHIVLAHARWNTRKTVDMPAVASNANWPFHHLDYWGVANCAHVLLFGSAINMTALKRPKRYWNEPFWTAFFKTLVFSPKPTMDDGIQDLKGLIRDLEVSLNTKCVKDDAIYHLGQYDLSRKTK